MALYAELFDIRNDPAITNRCAVAIGVTASQYIDNPAATPDELKWAKEALDNPGGKVPGTVAYILASNKALTTDQILNATDSALQAKVDAAAAALIGVV